MPGPDHRKTKSEFLNEAAALLARLAMGAIDGDGRGSRFPPPALRCATYFGNAVDAAGEDPLGPQYSSTPGQGFTPEDLFAAAAAKLEPSMIEAGHEVLAEYYMMLQDDLGEFDHPPTPHEIAESVAFVLVRDFADEETDGTPASLWIAFMRACYPRSGHLKAALAAGMGDTTVKTDSQADLWAPWRKTPGTF